MKIIKIYEARINNSCAEETLWIEGTHLFYFLMNCEESANLNYFRCMFFLRIFDSHAASVLLLVTGTCLFELRKIRASGVTMTDYNYLHHRAKWPSRKHENEVSEQAKLDP